MLSVNVELHASLIYLYTQKHIKFSQPWKDYNWKQVISIKIQKSLRVTDLREMGPSHSVFKNHGMRNFRIWNIPAILFLISIKVFHNFQYILRVNVYQAYCRWPIAQRSPWRCHISYLGCTFLPSIKVMHSCCSWLLSEKLLFVIVSDPSEMNIVMSPVLAYSIYQILLTNM